jgi:hypothetical protein
MTDDGYVRQVLHIDTGLASVFAKKHSQTDRSISRKMRITALPESLHTLCHNSGIIAPFLATIFDSWQTIVVQQAIERVDLGH